MGEVEDSVRTLLRSTEKLKAVLESLLIQPPSTQENETNLADLEDSEQRGTRIIAVVSHKDEWGQGVSEEGSIFIFKYSNKISKELAIQRVIPITETFSITIAQTKYDHAATSVTMGHTGFSITINPGRGPDPEADLEPLTFFSHRVNELQVISKECKELQNIPPNTFQSETQFRWLLPYTSNRDLPPTFYSIPQDLRFINKPLYTQFSSASAGVPGDDVADLYLVRDDWIRTKAHEASRKGRQRLRIRLGTFNVNGQLPSQDLSSWVDGLTTANNPSEIPPLQQISPFSVGEFDLNPFDASTDSVSNSRGKGQMEVKPSRSDGPPVPISSVTALTEKDTTNEVNHIGSDSGPDIIVLGFQELDLSTEALIYATSTIREDAWCLAVFAALGEKAALYEKLVSKQLVGMLIVVITKKNLASCFSNIRTSAAGAGLMGVMGNKGGTAVHLTFTPVAPKNNITTPGTITFTFVNTHLAAFDEMFEKRNSDFQDLSKRLQFNPEVLDTGGLAPLPVSIYESDVLFWMGDLNYRIDLSDVDVRKILNSERWEGRVNALLKYDQLKNAIRNKKAFDGFYEHSITHPPTYRFSSGIGTDSQGYDIKRKPAWTDRILFMSAPTIGIQQLTYTSHPRITMSDHRPVAADFFVDVDLYDKDIHSKTAQQLYRSMHLLEHSSYRTSLKLDNVSIDMGKVSYKQRISQTIRVQNNGKIPCAYRFVPISVNSEIHPHWLHIEPMHALILPDEVACITLTVYVDNNSASKLNLVRKNLETTLILHTLMGKDHFISITGEYRYTCFANKLSILTRLPGPIRSLTSLDDLRPENRPINAPREVMRLVNWMMSSHTNVANLFISPANESILAILRECLDTGDEFPYSPTDPDPEPHLAFAATLLHLLDSLPDPVVPASLHERCVQMTSRDEAFELLDAFPPPSINLWISLTAFLHFICQPTSSEQPLEKAERIATIFAPVLLRDDLTISPVSPLGKRNFLLHFISDAPST